MSRLYYDVLMVSPSADRELITVVYRHLAKRYHPDRDPSPEAARRMAELNAAYATLSDPAKREKYDREQGLHLPASVRDQPGDDRPTRAGGASRTVERGPYGEAGQPPATPRAEGRPLTFGRYRGWTLNQVFRFDRGYIEWLARTSMGRSYKHELDLLLRRAP